MNRSVDVWMNEQESDFLIVLIAVQGKCVLSANTTLDDALLFAYVDGELDEDEKQVVEDLLAQNPNARQRVEQFLELNKLLKSAYRGDDGESG